MSSSRSGAGKDDPKGLYSTLGVAKSAEVSDIRKAYRRLALKWHPDKNPDNPAATEEFQKISAAYEVLSDAERRDMYDTTGCVDAEELEESTDLSHYDDLFATFFMGGMGMAEELDHEDQVLFDEFLRMTGGAAFRRPGRGGRGKKKGRGRKSKATASSRGPASMEQHFFGDFMAAMAGDTPSMDPQCPQGHRLKRQKADAEFGCDICTGHIPKGKRVYYCKKCDYSVCVKCHKKLVEELEAEAEADEDAEIELDEEDVQELLDAFCDLHTEPTRDGRRMKIRCELCACVVADHAAAAEHMMSVHSDEFQEFCSEAIAEGPAMAMGGGPGLEELLFMEAMMGGGLGAAGSRSSGGRKSKNKR